MVTTRANRPFSSGHYALNHKPHRARSVKEQPVCFFFNVFEKTKTPVKARASLEKLLKVSMESERGLTTSPTQLATVRQCFEELETLECRGTRENLSGTWRLLWTTEKETLFILKNAGIFGTQAGNVYQVIDTGAETLQNVIEFPPEGYFLVDSSLQTESSSGRSNFKFSSAKLVLPGARKIPFPPVGQGWFDSIFVSDKYRLSRDVRGDLLFVIREGSPRRFDD